MSCVRGLLLLFASWVSAPDVASSDLLLHRILIFPHHRLVPLTPSLNHQRTRIMSLYVSSPPTIALAHSPQVPKFHLQIKLASSLLPWLSESIYTLLIFAYHTLHSPLTPPPLPRARYLAIPLLIDAVASS